MKLTAQRRIASYLLSCSPHSIRFEGAKAADIKEAITKFDIWALIKQGAIRKEPIRGTSRGRARAMHLQKVSGRQRGHGSRKGASGARESPKKRWMNQIRTQRELLKSLKRNGNITSKNFRTAYNKAKGGFFRSRRHIKIYLDEHKLTTRP